MNYPYISVVIPTYNRCNSLKETIDSLCQYQTYPLNRYEIVVIDDGSSDHTKNMIHEQSAKYNTSIKYYFQDHRGINAARNLGIRCSDGEIICYLDDDEEAVAGWLLGYGTGYIKYPDAGCFGGPIKVRFEVDPPRICEMESWALEGELDYGLFERYVPFVHGGNMGICRWAVKEVGYFDETLPFFGEDLEWENRLTKRGIGIVYVPSALIWHKRTRSDLKVPTLVKRRFKQGREIAKNVIILGRPISIWRNIYLIPIYLFHAIRKQCWGALFEVSRKIGFSYEVVKYYYRNCKAYILNKKFGLYKSY